MKKTFTKASLRFTTVFCGLVLLFLGASTAMAEPELVDKVAIVVNDEIVLFSEITETLSQFATKLQGLTEENRAAKLKQLRDEIIDRTVDERLMKQQIRDLKYTVSEKEVDASIERIMHQNNIPDMTTFRAVLRRQGLDWDEYRQKVSDQLKEWQFVNAKVGNRVKISDEEVDEEFAKQQVTRTPEYEYHARHMLFKVDSTAAEDQVFAAKMRAEDALDRVRQGENFSVLAEKLSDGPSAKFGGDIGFNKAKDMVPEFSKAMVALQPGEVSEPVRTKYGFHIILLEEKREVAPPGGEEIKQRIRMQLREEEMKRQMAIWLKDLRRKAYIEIKIDDYHPSNEQANEVP